jgi:ABC-type dipeptide/oligopeptide/nickel transport system permease subunit
VDILLSMPALLVMLLLITALNNSFPVLVLATSLVLMPGVARIVRSATLEVSTRGYIEAAVARGESTRAILTREIMPNIGGVVTADLGLRFSWAIILIASVNFLGIGIQPPTPDWGVMASENRVALATNPMAVVGPCLALALLVVAVNLVGDAYIRQLDRSGDTQ